MVVDDFAVKYTQKKDVEHLFTCLRSKYKIKVDWEAKQYIGIHMEWDYNRRTVKLSMKGYVQHALHELEHIKPKQHFLGPSKMTVPDYGQKIQYVKEDMENMVNDLPDVEFIDQAKDYWEDGYPDVVELIKEYANSDFQKPKEDRI